MKRANFIINRHATCADCCQPVKPGDLVRFVATTSKVKHAEGCPGATGQPVVMDFTGTREASTPAPARKRFTLEVAVTLPADAFTEEYVSRLAAAVEGVRPDLKGQRAMVCYIKDREAGSTKK